MVMQRFRAQMPTLVGAALLSLPLDGLILLYRLIGLSRSAAVYMGLLTFSVLGGLLARRYFRPRTSQPLEGDENA